MWLLNIGAKSNATAGNLFLTISSQASTSGLCYLNRHVNVNCSLENGEIIGYICVETPHKSSAFVEERDVDAVQAVGALVAEMSSSATKSSTFQ